MVAERTLWKQALSYCFGRALNKFLLYQKAHIDILYQINYYASMRSTVDIHNSLNAELRRRASELGITFREALNRVIAAGLPALRPESEKKKVYRVSARACGLSPGVDLEHLNRMADELDDEELKKHR